MFCTVFGNQNAQTTDTSPRKNLKASKKWKKGRERKKKKREILDGPAEGGRQGCPGQGGSRAGRSGAGGYKAGGSRAGVNGFKNVTSRTKLA